MSIFRTASNTPEVFVTRDYVPPEALKGQVTFSKWITKYNRLAGTSYGVGTCPKDVKKLYREVHFDDLSKDTIGQKVHIS